MWVLAQKSSSFSCSDSWSWGRSGCTRCSPTWRERKRGSKKRAAASSRNLQQNLRPTLMALGPTNSLVFLQRKTLGKLNPPVRSERPPDTRSGRQSTMIPAVSRATTPGGLDTLLERRYAVELHAAFAGCGPKDAHLAASLGDRGGSIAQRSLQRPLESDGYDVTVRRMRPQALSCFATLPRCSRPGASSKV